MKHKKVALLFIDLDRFKLVNDSLGHAAGDRLLQLVAQRLREIGRQTDTLARLGGDEFTILLPDVDRVEEAMVVADKVLATLKQPFVLDGRDIFVSASIGISMYPDDGADVDLLMKHADTAMYRVKQQGRNGFQIYTHALDQRSLRRLELENQLHKALERKQLVLHYQPQFDLSEGRLRGVEALVRWQHPELGMISPTEFIPLAEENGLIVPIGAWVLETACRQVHAWREAGFPDLVMSVNLSVRQFFREDIARQVMRTIDDYCLAAHVLELEITESVAMEDVAYTIRTLESLAASGLRLAIDDFGTGYSSLSQLKKMPVKILKIDRSFVQDITTDSDDAEIVNAVITMAHRLGLKVIAEGVESQAQLAHLREQQCDFAQGFLFSRPLPAAELERTLREWDFRVRPVASPGWTPVAA
jgi:diguanylate cyclase (GGDEF)-like protein